jgi:ABC-type sugar transport system ATPase subunit
LIDGERRRFSSPAAAANAGIATIHQELSLVGSLSAADNFLLGTGQRAFAPVSRAKARTRARTLLEAMELSIDPDAPVETLTFAERQLIEIARALGQNARVLVMDEPTSALAEPDTERLFSRIERLVAEGSSVVYISHRMEEMMRLAGRITVLRDGRHVFTRPRSELSPSELIEAMVGKEAREAAPARGPEAPFSPILAVRKLTHAAAPLHDVSFELSSGEILGVAGLHGSGASELLHALFGASGELSASVLFESQRYAPSSPRAAFAKGVALVPGDRSASVIGSQTVLENATLSSLGRYAPYGVVSRERERGDAEREGQKLTLKAPSLDAPAAALSGGNQQKLAILRCLLAKPRVLLLDDPTRGVDLGAKAEIHELLRGLAQQGLGIVFHGTELGELLALCRRVLVFHRGRIVAEHAGETLTRERLLGSMMGAAS